MLRYVKGDATKPEGAGNKIIVHVCNDYGGWGSGFVLSLSNRWPQPEKTYRHYAEVMALRKTPLSLGMILIDQVEPDIWVVSMIAQHGNLKTEDQPIQYDVLEYCLTAVASLARLRYASVHMPLIGCDRGGGKWSEVEPIIERTLTTSGVDVVVYYLNRHPKELV